MRELVHLAGTQIVGLTQARRIGLHRVRPVDLGHAVALRDIEIADVPNALILILFASGVSLTGDAHGKGAPLHQSQPQIFHVISPRGVDGTPDWSGLVITSFLDKRYSVNRSQVACRHRDGHVFGTLARAA